jgi:hypothetical protein
MADLTGYAKQSEYSDPRVHAHLLDGLPTDVPGLTSVARNVIVHYRDPNADLPPQRMAEINHRWMDRLLDADQARAGSPLTAPRSLNDRVAGCCRDFTLFTVACLRHQGVPARSRIGFAGYFTPGYHHDHVVAEVWEGSRWVWVDPQIGREGWAFDTTDIPPDAGLFDSAAKVWTRYRAGQIDADQYGVGPGIPVGGAWFIRCYVFLELAHRQRDELLLWDGWGAMGGPGSQDNEVQLVDEIAALLLAADGGDESAESELAERYAADPRLHPGDRIESHTPFGEIFKVDLRTRESR